MINQTTETGLNQDQCWRIRKAFDSLRDMFPADTQDETVKDTAIMLGVPIGKVVEALTRTDYFCRTMNKLSKKVVMVIDYAEQLDVLEAALLEFHGYDTETETLARMLKLYIESQAKMYGTMIE